MKHLKKFKLFEGSLNDLDIEVTDAGPNGGDGGVQIVESICFRNR